jgi:hypothetical protein
LAGPVDVLFAVGGGDPSDNQACGDVGVTAVGEGIADTDPPSTGSISLPFTGSGGLLSIVAAMSLLLGLALVVVARCRRTRAHWNAP